MIEVNLLIAVLLSLGYAIVLNISKGIQKYGIDGLSIDTLKQWKQRPELKKKFFTWVIGSAGTTGASLLLIIAQPFVPNSSFPVAFSGVGLMCLVIFSYFILNEQIKLPEIIGVFVVLTATLIFGLNAGNRPSTQVDYMRFALLGIPPLVIFLLCGLWSIKNNHRGHAIIWGALAGLCAGLAVSFAQTAAISGNRDLLAMIYGPEIYIALLLGGGAFWFTQYGFKHGMATIVITLYNTLLIAVPVCVDIFVLKQDLPFIQLAMLFCIGIGVILLTAFRESST